MFLSNLTYEWTWDLEVFFKGGSESKEFEEYLHFLEAEIESFQHLIDQFNPPNTIQEKDSLENILSLFQKIVRKIRQAGAFVSCLQAQNTADKKAAALRARVMKISASMQTALTSFDQKLVMIQDDVWKQLLTIEPFTEISFVLNERRERTFDKLPAEQEALIHALAVDGYHSWGQLYNSIVGSITIPFKENGKEKKLSVGQAYNVFSHPNRDLRRLMFEKWEKAWGEKADLIAAALNHLAGFRLSVYKQRGWEDVLKEPLEINRMSKETLLAMWNAITDNKKHFIQYLNRKAEMFGTKQLAWYDLYAPIGKSAEKISYQDGAEFILQQFSRFGKKLTQFTQKALLERWIEAEDRPGKAPGGFCTSFPESNQSRIFMTFSGTPSNVSTLAHELGHAFHQFVMADVHPLNRNYAMNVAETASTFAEMIVADAAVKHAKSQQERIIMLEDRIQRSSAFFMDIHARFLFEMSFYEERKKGVISTERLNELMVQAQKEAYGDSLEVYHPYFWASKLHFYLTNVPFYNFPYTFGYLFSLGIYAKALEEGKNFEEKYISLLRDTASMTVEDLAEKHLNVDLTKKDFWNQAIQLTVKDMQQFIALTE
jgi:oligoendopeptidase F